MKLSDKLLRKNMSTARIVGFALSNFIGLAIILAGLQFFLDARSLWEDEDSFIKKDYIVVNKRVTANNTLGFDSGFTPDDVADLQLQPWLRKVGVFTAADFRVAATLSQQGREMTTSMFLESIPDEFIDVADASWRYTPGAGSVPIIISKDYLTLYNFGFASSTGMPQLSEGLMSSIPMTLTLSGKNSDKTIEIRSCIVGYSNRLNTILVPESFMAQMNTQLGTGRPRNPSRLILDVSSPGDVAITQYLDSHGLEMAGDKSGSQASFLLKIVTGIILAIGSVITLLSFFILLLSISLLMEKNRDKMHTLLMLGYPLKEVGAPFRRIIFIASTAALLAALLAVLLLRVYYGEALSGMTTGSTGNLWLVPLTGILLTAAIIIFNILAVRKKVIESFR